MGLRVKTSITSRGQWIKSAASDSLWQTQMMVPAGKTAFHRTEAKKERQQTEL
jgi:uncharacterized protein YbdZ (MbtH family)